MPMPPPQHTPHDETAGAAPEDGESPPFPQKQNEASPAVRLSLRPGTGSGGRSPAGLELHLSGELDVDTAPKLRERLTALAARFGDGPLVLNLSGITFCDSSGLYTLLGIRQALHFVGLDVMFIQPSAVIRTAAERAGLTTHLALHDGP